MVVDKKTPFVFPSNNELYLVSLSMYLHSKLQAINVDKEVSTDISFYFYHAPTGAMKGNSHITIDPNDL